MTVTTVDKILDLLEQPIQHSSGGFSMPPDDSCWRCRRNKASEGLSMCDGCRAWMTCETDDDPDRRTVR